MSNGVRTTNLPFGSIPTEIVGNLNGSTVRVPTTNLAWVLGNLQIAVYYVTRAQLYADIAWSAGVRGAVLNDPNPAFNGIYEKSGAVGSGAWTRLHDLPTAGLTAEIVASMVAAQTAATTATTQAGIATAAATAASLSEQQAQAAALLAGAPIAPAFPTTNGEVAALPSPFLFIAPEGVQSWTHSGTVASLAQGTYASRVEFDDIQAVLAYAGPPLPTGLLIGTRRERAVVYEVAASGATDQHVTTAGGVKLYVLPLGPNKYHVAQIGAVGSGNETALVQALIDLAPAGSEIHLDGSATYTLAVKAHKPLWLVPNGATLVNAEDNDFIVAFMSSVALVDHAVTETTLPYGSTQFTVVGASTLFQVGDIGVLHDGRVRPSDSAPVNFHCVKIAGISGNVITIERPTMAHMGGTIVFQHTTGQYKDAGIIGDVHVDPTPTHTFPAIFMQDIERPRFDRITGRGTTGHGVSIRRCYDLRCGDTDFRAPAAAGSGEGYGFVALNSTGGWVGNIHGVGMRHAFDIDSTYNLTVGLVSDPNPVSSPCVLGHTGFVGHIDVRGYRGGNPDGAYPVSTSNQGYGSSFSATGDPLFPARKIKVGFVDVAQRSGSPEDFGGVGVYFQTYVEDIDIGPITVDWPSSVTPTNAAASFVVRVLGGCRGYFRTGPITVNKIGTAVSLRATAALDAAFLDGLWDIGPVTITDTGCRQVWIRNGGRLRYVGGQTKTGTGNSPVFIERVAPGNQLLSAEIGLVGAGLGEVDTEIVSVGTPRLLRGNIAKTALRSATGIVFASAGDNAITAGQLYTRTALLRCSGSYSPVGTHDITSFPAPQYDGQEITIKVIGGFQDIRLVASATVDVDITIPRTESRLLVANSGKWEVMR